jgi:hypothetical protein
VHVLGRAALPASQEVLHTLIDPRDLPKEYGGELDWKFEDSPALDEDAKSALGGKMTYGPAWYRDGKVVLAKASADKE